MSLALVERLAFRAAMPLVMAQGLWVKRTASRYAPAGGPREGRRTFDRMAGELVSGISGTLFVPNRFEPKPAFFSPDGYHPSEESCAMWAGRVAEILAVEGRASEALKAPGRPT